MLNRLKPKAVIEVTVPAQVPCQIITVDVLMVMTVFFNY